MARWAPGSRGRLENAALELFEAKGFAATTVPEIAARAGLTTRTFFRHFDDKREVLFADGAMSVYAREAIEGAPLELTPIELVRHLLHRSANEQFQEREDRIRRVRAIVMAEPTLRERELAKRHELSASIEAGLVARGIQEVPARLLADLSVTVMYLAVDRWLASPDGGPGLSVFIDEILDVHQGMRNP